MVYSFYPSVVSPFPEKLYEMLEIANELGFSDTVAWCPHGRAFIVHKPKQFASNTMRTYFKHTKFTSFQRQLNLYGFRRITKGRDSGAYYHEFFLRGRPDLCKYVSGNIIWDNMHEIKIAKNRLKYCAFFNTLDA